MNETLNKDYFDGKKTLAQTNLTDAVATIETACALIESLDYARPSIPNGEHLANLLSKATYSLEQARENFAKAQWAASKVKEPFETWYTKASKAKAAKAEVAVHIKDVPVAAVEQAMADSFQSKLGGQYKVSITRIDFSNLEKIGTGAIVPIEMNVTQMRVNADGLSALRA